MPLDRGRGQGARHRTYLLQGTILTYVLESLAAEILRDVPGVVSVTYNIATKPPSTIEAV